MPTTVTSRPMIVKKRTPAWSGQPTPGGEAGPAVPAARGDEGYRMDIAVEPDGVSRRYGKRGTLALATSRSPCRRAPSSR
ncbi:hypothetical protein GCM10025331_19850 [Actinoplanes utahensis]|nr:hypothetical protein Aut01nite_37540 [Actinoplanes utahensis]